MFIEFPPGQKYYKQFKFNSKIFDFFFSKNVLIECYFKIYKISVILKDLFA